MPPSPGIGKDASLLARRDAIVRYMGAQGLVDRPYTNPRLPASSGRAAAAHASRLARSVRVYYIPRYLAPARLEPLLTRVPFVCVDGDSSIQLQDGDTYYSLDEARGALTDDDALIDNVSRRLSRNKCIASLARVFAVGGYNTPLRVLGDRRKQSDGAGTDDVGFDCIVVSGAGPQFEASYLDYADFIFSEDAHARLPEYSHLGGPWPHSWDTAARDSENFVPVLRAKDLLFHRTGYLAAMTESMRLWLHAFDDMVGRTQQQQQQQHTDGGTSSDETQSQKPKKGYMKLTAIGSGFFASVGDTGANLTALLMPLLLEAAEAAILSHQPRLERIAALEFPDFSPTGTFTPTSDSVAGVRLIAAPRRDVLDFSDDVRREYVLGLLNPGDCFACVGNELGYSSVESMIGNNTTIRTTQCYIWNEHVLDEENWIPVDI